MQDNPTDSAGISGRAVVAVMFAFAIMATGLLWTYWHYHTAPFIPLQTAIAAEFPDSVPRVDGGTRKMHKGTPRQLWIVMHVPFHPGRDIPRFESMSQRLSELSQQHLDLTDYDQLNIRLFFGEPERAIYARQREVLLDEGAIASFSDREVFTEIGSRLEPAQQPEAGLEAEESPAS